MEKKNFLKILSLLLIFIFIQAYVVNNIAFNVLIKKWTGYFIPLIWALFISVLLEPVVCFIEEKLKINKLFSVILSFILIFIILILLLLMIVPQLLNSAKELNALYPYIVEKVTEFSEKIIHFLEEKNILNLDTNELTKGTSNFFKGNMDYLKNFATSLLTNIISLTVNLTNFVLGGILAFLLLLNKNSHMKTLANILKIFFAPENAKYIEKKLVQTKDIFLDYISGKIIVSFIVGLSVFIILFITKTPYASLSAVLLGLGNMIPYVGSIIAGAVSAFLIFLATPLKIVFLIIAIIVSQLLDGFIIGPKIIGDKVGLNSFWVMVSMIIFGGLFGIMGMFLGIPIMCVIKMIYRDILEKKRKEENI